MPSKKRTKPTQANVAATGGHTGNSAENSAKPRRGNPAKTEPYRFKPGQSGNPSGRPKCHFTDAIRDLAGEIVKEDKLKRTHVALAVLGMYKEAIKGNVQAFSVLADRTEGKPMQAHEVSGPGGGAIPLTSLTPEENEKRIAELLAKGGM